MGIGTTFGAFTTARLGIYASQKALSVVGNNIANINTVGYTRQSLSQKSMNLGGADKYSSRYAIRVGTGALVTGVNQLRDPYLDIRYRNEQASAGYMAAKLDGLNHISTYLDEVGKGEEDEGVLEAQFNDLISQIEQLSAAQGVGRDSADTLVRSAANSLTVTLRSYAGKLDTLLEEQEDAFKQDLENVNIILKNIRELNSSIRKSQIYGSDSLEQKDERNNLIDELSQYIRINVSYEQEDIGAGNTVEKLVIKLAGDDTSNTAEAIRSNGAVLVDGNYAARLSIQKVPRKNEKGEFLDKDGNVVADEAAAEKIQDPYFRLSVGPLKDKYERVLVLDSKIAKAGEFPAGLAGKKTEAEAKLAELEAVNTDENVSYELRLTTDDAGKIEYQVVSKATSESTVQKDGADQVFDTKADAQAAAKALKKDHPDAVYTVVPNEDETSFTIRETTVTEKVENSFSTGMTAEQAKEAAQNFIDTQPTKGKDADGNTLEHIYSLSEQKDEEGVIVGYEVLKTTNTLSSAQKLTDNTLYGSLQAKRELLTEQGEYATREQIAMDSNAPSKRGIPYYRKSLDTLANKLASVLNEANTIPDEELYETDGAGGFLDENGQVTTDPAKYVRKKGYENYKGGPLFSNSGSGDDPTGITAANISVSKSWADGLTRIVHSKAENPTSTDNTNSLHILSLMMSSGHEFTPDAFDLDTGSATAGEAFFKGSFQEFFTDQIGGTLANDRMSTQTMYQNFSTVVDELYVDRDAVSGVDLNDEAMNLMQFQKSYTAACRLMTTVDELLDRLINGTGRAGL